MKPALILIILFSSTSAFSQSCDSRIQAAVYTLLSIKLYSKTYNDHRMQIGEKYDALDRAHDEKLRNATDSEREQLERQGAELYRQRMSEFDNARSTAFNNKNKCSDPSFTHDLNLVYEEQKKGCIERLEDAENLTEGETLADAISPTVQENKPKLSKAELIKKFERAISEESMRNPVGCAKDGRLLSEYKTELGSDAMRLPVHRVCEIIMDKLAAKNSNCTEDLYISSLSANNSSSDNSDPNTCEIAGPDGRCPGAPKEVSVTPLSAQDMRNIDFLNNGSTLQQRRQRARQGAAR